MAKNKRVGVVDAWWSVSECLKTKVQSCVGLFIPAGLVTMGEREVVFV